MLQNELWVNKKDANDSSFFAFLQLLKFVFVLLKNERNNSHVFFCQEAVMKCFMSQSLFFYSNPCSLNINWNALKKSISDFCLANLKAKFRVTFFCPANNLKSSEKKFRQLKLQQGTSFKKTPIHFLFKSF